MHIILPTKLIKRAARSCQNASEEQTARLNELFTPLVLNGQSVSHIFASHSEEFDFSRRTIYNYIDKCVFDVRNIDLPRKVRYKKRKTKSSEPAQYAYRQGRTYADFKAFMESHPELDVVEMDTVKGRRDKGKCLLTMIFTKYDLMLIFLIESASQKCVQAVFDELTEKLDTGIFQRLFTVILTDNGGEFKTPDSLENTDYGVRRTNIFYCQPISTRLTLRILTELFPAGMFPARNAILTDFEREYNKRLAQ